MGPAKSFFYTFAIIACSVALGVKSEACNVNADCAGYKEDSFCNKIECDTNKKLCVTYPNPCPGACSEDELDWCHGGKQVCEESTGRCVPGKLPCKNIDTCISAFKQCFACQKDSECGEYDFCKNPVVCDKSTGQCLEHVARCKDNEHCDSKNERCVQCLTDEHCSELNDEFCKPPLYCDVTAGTCKEKEDTPNPCYTKLSRGDSTVISRCNEIRKTCTPVSCVVDSECDDGDCSNGKESCVRNQCVRTFTGNECTQAPPSQSSTPPTSTAPRNPPAIDVPNQSAGEDRILGNYCTVRDQCDSGGYLCKPANPNRPTQKTCQKCLDDAECSDGISTNGEEQCDLSTGKCKPSAEYNAPSEKESSLSSHDGATDNSGNFTSSDNAPTSQPIGPTLHGNNNALGGVFDMIYFDNHSFSIATNCLFGRARPIEGALLLLAIFCGGALFIGLVAYLIYYSQRGSSKKPRKTE